MAERMDRGLGPGRGRLAVGLSQDPGGNGKIL